MASKTFAADRISLGNIDLMSGSADPNTLTFTPAPPVGSMYFRTDGSMWVNEDGSNTGWFNTRVNGSDVFGDGSLGDLTVNGTTTEAGATDRFYNNITIGAAGVYNNGGRRIWCRGTCTIAAGGLFANDGNNAAAGAGGAASAGLNLFPGTAGGAGNAAAGSNGTAGSALTKCIPPTQHGLGGGGGAGSGGAGGAAGTQAAVQTVVGGGRSSLIAGVIAGGEVGGGGGALATAPGMGGGGGGGNGAQVGGGGGGGGGVIILIARKIVAPGAIPFRARGGDGAAGTSNNCGGGGGGGGGSIVLVTRQYSGTALVAATHTPGGAGGASGGGAGVAGTAGSSGLVLTLSI